MASYRVYTCQDLVMLWLYENTIDRWVKLTVFMQPFEC